MKIPKTLEDDVDKNIHVRITGVPLDDFVPK